MNTLFKAIDIFFFVFHISFIVFNLFGWAFKPLRKWNLLTLGLTAFSWFILGLFYGFGYCFLTDWHWQIREKLGYANPFNSYIQFLIVTLLGLSAHEDVVDLFTAIFFLTACFISIIVNVVAMLKLKNLNKKANVR